jgi:hypothetical protein
MIKHVIPRNWAFIMMNTVHWEGYGRENGDGPE